MTRQNSDTPFGFGSREWLGDTPGSDAGDEPPTDPSEDDSNLTAVCECGDGISASNADVLAWVDEHLSMHRSLDGDPGEMDRMIRFCGPAVNLFGDDDA